MSGNAEIELCYFAEVAKPEGFAEASAIETHDQYEYRLPPGEGGVRRGRQRVRKTVKNNETSFELMIKSPRDPSSMLGDTETPCVIDEAFYNAWKKTFLVPGQRKIRYTFVSEGVVLKYQGDEIKLPALKFEVDQLIAANGKKSKWVKIDIEVQSVIEFLKSSYENIDAARFEISFDSLPLGIGQIVSADTKNADERAAIDNFFKVYSIPPEVDNERRSDGI